MRTLDHVSDCEACQVQQALDVEVVGCLKRRTAYRVHRHARHEAIAVHATRYVCKALNFVCMHFVDAQCCHSVAQRCRFITGPRINRTRMSSNRVPWSTFTNSVSQVLTSSSVLAGLSLPSCGPASTWYLQYSITCRQKSGQWRGQLLPASVRATVGTMKFVRPSPCKFGS